MDNKPSGRTFRGLLYAIKVFSISGKNVVYVAPSRDDVLTLHSRAVAMLDLFGIPQHETYSETDDTVYFLGRTLRFIDKDSPELSREIDGHLIFDHDAIPQSNDRGT